MNVIFKDWDLISFKFYRRKLYFTHRCFIPESSEHFTCHTWNPLHPLSLAEGEHAKLLVYNMFQQSGNNPPTKLPTATQALPLSLFNKKYKKFLFPFGNASSLSFGLDIRQLQLFAKLQSATDRKTIWFWQIFYYFSNFFLLYRPCDFYWHLATCLLQPTIATNLNINKHFNCSKQFESTHTNTPTHSKGGKQNQLGE